MSEPKEQYFLNPPHDQSRHTQRHTVQGTTFYRSLEIHRGCSAKKSILGKFCINLGAFSMSGSFQNGTGKGRGELCR